MTILDLFIGIFTGNTFPPKIWHKKSSPKWWFPWPMAWWGHLVVFPRSRTSYSTATGATRVASALWLPRHAWNEAWLHFFYLFLELPRNETYHWFHWFPPKFPLHFWGDLLLLVWVDLPPGFRGIFFPNMCFQCCELWKQGVWRFEPFSFMQVLKMTFLLWQP